MNPQPPNYLLKIYSGMYSERVDQTEMYCDFKRRFWEDMPSIIT